MLVSDVQHLGGAKVLLKMAASRTAHTNALSPVPLPAVLVFAMSHGWLPTLYLSEDPQDQLGGMYPVPMKSLLPPPAKCTQSVGHPPECIQALQEWSFCNQVPLAFRSQSLEVPP